MTVEGKQAAALATLVVASSALVQCEDNRRDYFLNDPEEQKPACVRFVDWSTSAAMADGLSWDKAFSTVQRGIDSAVEATRDSDGGESAAAHRSCEVWVNGGVYEVFISAREDTIVLQPGIKLYGGFDGSERYRSQRNWQINETVLDGEASGDRVCHVVSIIEDGESEPRAASKIDGFTISDGDASCDGPDGGRGGGMIVEALAVVENCRFKDNTAQDGGGLFYSGDKPLAVVNCEFSGNQASNQGGGMISTSLGPVHVRGSSFNSNQSSGDGGGLCIAGGEYFIRECTFDSNTSLEGRGGGIAILHDERGCMLEHRLERCSFIRNSGSGGGGGLYTETCRADISNSVFATNEGGRGGGLESFETILNITNCTFFGNQGTHGGAASFRGDGSSTDVHIWNTIVWGNISEEATLQMDTRTSGGLKIGHSLIQDKCNSDYLGCGARSNVAVLDEDPMLRDESSGDLRLDPDSPCIDAADGFFAPPDDLDGNPRIDDPGHENTGLGPPWADIGAYEFGW